MTVTLRAARRADLPAIYDLLELCFPEAQRALFVAQVEHDSTFRFRHARVAEVDGRVAGYVRMFARTMLVRGVPVAAGGIGSVATHPEARHGGIATALLGDAIAAMRGDGVLLSFLFTGITGFYERLGYRIVREPWIEVEAAEAAREAQASLYGVRRMRDGDVPRLLAIYRQAAAGSTGAIARTQRTWRDGTSWLGERDGDALVAERNGVPVAYLRSRCRTYGHQILEAELLPNHDEALASLLAAVGERAAAHGERLTALVPDGHLLGVTMRALTSATVTTDVPYPMMLRVVSLDGLLRALLPYFRGRAAGHPGPEVRLGLSARGGEAAVLRVVSRSAGVERGGADVELGERATLDGLIGQRRVGRLARPRPDAALARRIDALLPEAALRFWNTDRV
ncbi:MAG TPA: GNAT family N-acetyltransferase [Dehalococcoidia bacterium]|nr:GNAT family N-acetyltransferase [Dehalococcoidia bacterium]